MFDARIYRAGFLPAVAAVVALMFSLEPAPEPLQQPISTPTFQGRETARLARSIAALAPGRTPGSSGDAAVAALVEETFTAIEGGAVATQDFEGSFEGEDVELRNVVLTLPGLSEEVLLIVADRDSPVGQGATASAAATATLLSLAQDLGGARHQRTIVLASTTGGSIGSAGVRELVEELPAPGGIEAAIAIEAPGVSEPRPPFVVPGHSGPRSTSAELLATADAIATTQFGRDALTAGTVRQFARLALPVGVGGEAVLEEIGGDAEVVAISATGERAPDPDEGTAEEVSAETIFAAGSTVLALTLTLDEAREPLQRTPASYLRVGDNLLPGWTLALLALTLLLPALLAAGDVWLRDRRRNPRVTARTLPWALERALLPLAALLLAYAVGFVGLLPDASYPYDPARFTAGADGVIALALLALAVVLAALLVRPLRTPLDAEPQTLAAAAGLVCCLGVIAVWFFNPFLALCLTGTAHLWLLPARPQGPPGLTVTAVAAALSLVPAVIVAGEIAGALELGYSVGWHLLLWLVEGEIGLGIAIGVCLVLGGLLATVAACRGGVVLPKPTASVRGPAGHAGPGSLGAVPSTISRD